MVMRKVSMKKRVRMVLRAFMLMNVQKRRLKKQDRQREIHQYGNTTLHNAYSTVKYKARIPSVRSGNLRPSRKNGTTS